MSRNEEGSTDPRARRGRLRSTEPRTRLEAQRIVIRDMTVLCSIGVSAEERARRQRVRLDLQLELEPAATRRDRIAEVVNYGPLVERLRNVMLETEARLLETLGEQVARACFMEQRIVAARIRLEKLDRYADIGGVGIEIEHRRAED